jgi:hypothetical protein
MPDATPARRWPIWPFVPAAIVIATIPPILWTGTVIPFMVREFLDGNAVGLYQLATAVTGGSLLALVYGFVRSLSDGTPERWWRIRPFIAAVVMVVAIPSLVWIGHLVEIMILDGTTYDPDLWQLAKGIVGGSLITLIYGLPHSLLVTTAIVGGTRILIHRRLDSIWASLLLGAPLGLIVLGTPPVERESLPYLMIAAGAASALNWWIVVRPLRISRLAHGKPPRPSPIS